MSGVSGVGGVGGVSSAPIAITPGDPRGIGAECAVAAWATTPDLPVVFVGDAATWKAAARLRGVDPDSLPIEAADPLADPEHGHLPEIAAIASAVRGALAGRFRAVVTGPIHKADLLAAGFPFPGHTPYLAHLCGLDPAEAVMVFAGGRLTVGLATVHVPLARVPQELTPAALRRAIDGVGAVLRARGVPSPRIAVCGLNPHAGEGGALGSEDAAVIAPVVDGFIGGDVSGPHPADTVFARAVAGDFDGVVACYHDQGLIPVKTLDFGRSVNITAGLPIWRTSVDHGTARDLAGTGRADPRHMVAALAMAAELA